jgi:CDGSH-type Zn-finger protein
MIIHMAKITIKAIEDGPCIINVDGNKVAALCRCGASNKKPHCDGSHSKSGFKAQASEIDV